MSIASVDYNKLDKSRKVSLNQALAKRALNGALSQLPYGRLVIEDGDQVLEFGQSAEQAELTAHIYIRDAAAYRDILFGGSIGAAEAYMLGRWESPNIVDLMRLMARNINLLNGFDHSRPLLRRCWDKLTHRLNGNSLTGSKKNISAHYDLSNDFFALFLDENMMYSSAIFAEGVTDLEQASLHKLDTICQKLQLSADDHLLEIGTGWGGLAVHAASQYGCCVTTTTISREQFDQACQRVQELGLQEQVTVLLQDYRLLDGEFDKLVSVEMIEAVGHEYYQDYFSQCSRLLKADGLMLIQAITIPDQRYEQARRNVDFIQRYIFPGGCLPSNAVMAQCVAEHTDMQICHLQDIGLDYAKTLAVWRERFHREIDAVKQLGFDDIFCRMWEFYLTYCEGGFRERAISTVQVLLAKPHARPTV